MFFARSLVNIGKRNYNRWISRKRYPGSIRRRTLPVNEYASVWPGCYAYTGRRQTPERIAHAPIQEGVDAIGLSIHSGAHKTLVGRILDLLRRGGAIHMPVFARGVIPKDDTNGLTERGMVEIFGHGAHIDHMVERIQDEILRKGGRNDQKN